MKRKIVTITTAFLLLLISIGCSKKPHDTITWRVATGGMTGTNYISGAALVAMINEQSDDTTGYVQATSGANENIQLLRDKEVELGYCNSTTAVEQKNELTGISSIGCMMIQDIHVIINKNTDISSLEDIRGKKVSVGSMGSGIEVVTQSILQTIGIEPDEYQHIYGSTGEAFEQVCSGDSDCYIAITTTGGTNVADCLKDNSVTLLQLDDDTLNQISKDSEQYMEDIIPAGTYYNIDYDYHTLAAPVLLLVRDDISEDNVYNLTKAIFENYDYLIKQSSLMEHCLPENACKGNPVKLHPGASKYLSEKGIEINQ